MSKTYEDGRFYLGWAVKHQDVAITAKCIEILKGDPRMRDIEPADFSKHLWGWLNLSVGKGEARLIFDNVEQLNGLEAWRRIVAPIDSRTEAAQLTLFPNVLQRRRCNTLISVLHEFEAWDKDVCDYIATGG